MKLLIDHQLPPRLVTYFRGKGIEATHVSELGLEPETDRAIWLHAISQQMHIVSKDEDSFYLASSDEPGPRPIWVRLGNCSSHVLIAALDRLWPQVVTWMESEERVVEIR